MIVSTIHSREASFLSNSQNASPVSATMDSPTSRVSQGSSASSEGTLSPPKVNEQFSKLMRPIEPVCAATLNPICVSDTSMTKQSIDSEELAVLAIQRMRDFFSCHPRTNETASDREADIITISLVFDIPPERAAGWLSFFTEPLTKLAKHRSALS